MYLWFDTKNNVECISSIYHLCVSCEFINQRKCEKPKCKYYDDFNNAHQYIYYTGQTGSALMKLLSVDINSFQNALLEYAERYIERGEEDTDNEEWNKLFLNFDKHITQFGDFWKLFKVSRDFHSYIQEYYKTSDEFHILEHNTKIDFFEFKCVREYLYTCLTDNNFYDTNKLEFACKHFFTTSNEIKSMQTNVIGLDKLELGIDVYNLSINMKDEKDFIIFFKDFYDKATKYDDERFKSFDKVYDVEHLAEFAFVELYEIFKAGYKFNKCENCGVPFIPYNRSDTMYCDRLTPQDNTKTCKEYGGRQAYQESLKTNKSMRLYRNIYMAKQMLAKRNPDIQEYQDDFEEYKTKAAQWKKDVKAGVKTDEEYITWLKSVRGRRYLD